MEGFMRNLGHSEMGFHKEKMYEIMRVWWQSDGHYVVE
jgi:hypothetical protein